MLLATPTGRARPPDSRGRLPADALERIKADVEAKLRVASPRLPRARPVRRRIYLMRHADVAYFDERGRPVDPRTVPLSAAGVEQAAAPRATPSAGPRSTA